MTTIEKINLITRKVQQLLGKNQELLHRNQELQSSLEQERTTSLQALEENSLLKAALETAQTELERKSYREVELKINVSELEAQVENLKHTSSNLDEASRKAMEKQLNQYIKEIDRCIALLSQ